MKPFDVNAEGTVPADGGSFLVIETEEHAIKRGANILAEICDYQ